MLRTPDSPEPATRLKAREDSRNLSHPVTEGCLPSRRRGCSAPAPLERHRDPAPSPLQHPASLAPPSPVSSPGGGPRDSRRASPSSQAAEPHTRPSGLRLCGTKAPTFEPSSAMKVRAGITEHGRRLARQRPARQGLLSPGCLTAAAAHAARQSPAPRAAAGLALRGGQAAGRPRRG